MRIIETPQTKNDCYKQAKPMRPVGILIHSTAANNKNLNRYVDAPAELGKNRYENHWNKPNFRKCMHAFIGLDINKSLAVAHTLPYTVACWGCGSGSKGSYNRDPTGHIQFEICEDGRNDAQYYHDVFALTEDYCVYLCKKFRLTEKNITSHYEAHDLGYASNHGDPRHWMRLFGDSMDKFRARVAARLAVMPSKAIKMVITRQENADALNKPINSVVTMDIEQYLLGVVPAEIGNAHIEACKAQAIAARSFAIKSFDDGTIINDTTSYQAYRAPRATSTSYANAHNGVKQTAGLVLTYNGEIINKAYYSDCNGGTILSSEEVWSGKRPYLVHKSDPWTAATDKPKNGHGVGLSQAGAKYAAENGVNSEDILRFYYEGVKIEPWYDISKSQEGKDSEDKVNLSGWNVRVDTRLPAGLNLWSTKIATNRNSLKKVAKGNIMKCLQDHEDGWATCEFEGVTGYADTQYLTATSKFETAPAPVPVEQGTVSKDEILRGLAVIQQGIDAIRKAIA